LAIKPTALRIDHRPTTIIAPPTVDLNSVPDWLAAVLIPEALATLGFVGKQILEWLTSIRAAKRERRARLGTLPSLPNGSAAVDRVQAVLRNRLLNALRQRDPELAKITSGYAAVFEAAFPTMTEAERQLHGVVRAYTVEGNSNGLVLA
jgi:hypothetical protein